MKEDNEQKAEKIIAQETEIKSLLETIKKERKRVVGLASLAKPLQTYSGLVDRFLFQESREIRHQLHYAATTTPSFNYQHIFDEGVIEDLGQLRREREQRNFFTSSVYKSNVKGEIAVSVQIVVDWITNTSTNAGNHIESSSGKSLNVYLPSPDEEVTSLSKLATGRDLCRVIVALIYDTIAARSETINRFREHQALNTVTPTGKQKRRLSVMLSHASNTSLTVSLGDLHHISTIQNNPLELLSYSLKLAVQYLQLPMFKAIDIFAGKSDIIYALGVALMACSKPIVHREDATEINDQIEKIQRLNRMHEKIFDSKKELSLLKEIYRNRSIHLGEEITDEFFGDSRQATELQLDSVVGKEKDGAKPDSSEPVQGQVYKVVNRDETYSFLTESIDQFLKKREDFYVTKLSVEDLDICQEFLNLQITAAKSREKREFGMKMTTELRKFVETKFIESVMRKSGILADELSEV